MKNLFEWKDYSETQVIRTKVCIIGSGCGGATLARELQSAGIDTIILEKGGHYPTSSFDNWELNMAAKVSAERNLQMDQQYQANLVSGNNVGGASVHYWADSYRTPTDRLELWENNFGIKHHTLADLSPYWDILETRLSVHEPKKEYYNAMNLKMKSGAKTLSWSGHPVPQARKNCQKSGHCMQGCAFGAKQSQLVTHIEDFMNLGGRVYADLEADLFQIKDSSTEKSIQSLKGLVIDREKGRMSGKSIEVFADTFIVAAGGFHSSAFLLKQGWKKDLPVLGEFFGMNASPMVHAIFDENMFTYRNIPAAFGIDEFRTARFDSKNQYVEGGYMLMANQLQPGTFASMIPFVGEKHYEWMRSFNQVGGTIGWIDDLTGELGNIKIEDKNRVVTPPDGPNTRKQMLDLIKKQITFNFKVGAKKVLVPTVTGIELNSLDELPKLDNFKLTPHSLLMAAPHPFGGCRMGKDSKTSVVDYRHKVHGFKNLYISDSSVFPTGPSVDPSFTIMAFSMRLSDFLKEELV
jgi:choline dehydrogenase-like flavoprotein